MTVLDPEMAEKIGMLQVLDDAIAFRLGRLNSSCPACRPDVRCAEHGRDEELVTSYTERYAATLSGALEGVDPADMEVMFLPGDVTPPTVSAVGAALMAQLRDLAATGPVILELDGRTVLIEQDGPMLIEHPLIPGSGPRETVEGVLARKRAG